MTRASLLAAVLCACAVGGCSGPSADITTASNQVTQLLERAGGGRLSGHDAKTLRDDLQTLVAQQAGQNALVATGALQTAGQQAAAALARGIHALGDRGREHAAHATVCTEAFGVDTAPRRARARLSDPRVSALVGRAVQLRGGTQAPEAYLNALTDAFCRASGAVASQSPAG